MARIPTRNSPINRSTLFGPPEPEGDTTILTDTERDALTAKARARVEAKAKHAAEEAFLKAEEERLEREAHPQAFEEMREIRLNLAMYAQFITIDSRRYYHGMLYTVPKSLYDVLKEQEQRSHRHEAEIKSGDEYSKSYRRERNAALSFATGQVSQARF